MNTTNKKTALISGASFAGLSTAYWMNKFGYQVTIVELGPGIKKGGTPVNILGRTIETTKRMGLFDKIIANKLTMESMEFKNADDITERQELVQKNQQEREEEYEIERDILLDIMYDAIYRDVNFIYSDSITSLTGSNDKIHTTFKKRSPRDFDLVFGCDGIHSAVRKYWFGEESQYTRLLQTYFSITIVDKLLIKENTTQLYSEPGRTVMLNAYNNKTDICLAFYAGQEIPYDYRNEQQQRDIIMDEFQSAGWRTKELLTEVRNSSTFYFDKLCQMRMPSWTKGRVALVGDAGYCASPAAGRGGSLAIDGAAALADAFARHPDDHELAFKAYNTGFRPFIEEVQAGVVAYGLASLIPRTEEAIRKRNKKGFGF